MVRILWGDYLGQSWGLSEVSAFYIIIPAVSFRFLKISWKLLPICVCQWAVWACDMRSSISSLPFPSNKVQKSPQQTGVMESDMLVNSKSWPQHGVFSPSKLNTPKDNEDLDTHWWIRSQSGGDVPPSSWGKCGIFRSAPRPERLKWLMAHCCRKCDTKQQSQQQFDSKKTSGLTGEGAETYIIHEPPSLHWKCEINSHHINRYAHIEGEKWRFICTASWQWSRENILPADTPGWHFTRWKVVVSDFPWCIKLQSIHVETSLVSWDTQTHTLHLCTLKFPVDVCMNVIKPCHNQNRSQQTELNVCLDGRAFSPDSSCSSDRQAH